ncbi:hypothetical protein EYB25_009411 [Talaromyces marneffei]|uniref:uncharacterized protein n=1 Tax=Talaromyces marneffei TaxID=37727 RepID=UPI0012A7AAEE|nr:uncharacterized protein EYB26_008672 [Talaromyces marneffei]KAE8547618.1 hypothetical protein EYB25_009411 [Talaromyces marneffei]QGA20962.1 hypothetical protein EYB26_008672 [Talaromyces marneffei]
MIRVISLGLVENHISGTNDLRSGWSHNPDPPNICQFAFSYGVIQPRALTGVLFIIHTEALMASGHNPSRPFCSGV